MAYINGNKNLMVYTGNYIDVNEIKATRLWVNANANTTFAGQTISNLPNMSNYSYLIVAWEPAPTGNAIQYIQFKYNLSSGEKTSIPLGFIDSDGNVAHRKMKIISNTSILFEDGLVGANTTNNDRCVPVEIYGTNLL